MPATLTAREPSDAELAALVRAGDAGAADRLLRRHQGLIWKPLTFARLRAAGAPPGTDPRDIACACTAACWLAIPKWRPAKSKLSTFLTVVVRNEVSDYLRRERRVRETPTPPLTARHDDEDDLGVLGLDQFPARPRPRIDLGPALAGLPPVERCLVEAHYGIDGEPLGVVAAGNLLGLSREQATRIIDRALARLAELVDPDEVC